MIPFATSAETFFPLATIRAGRERRTDKAYENSILILSATAILALASPCLAAKPDFSKLEGSYRAKYQTNVTNSDVKGNVDVDISVSANGGKAVIQIVGYGYSPSAGLTVALLGRTSLKGSRKVAADNVLGAFYVKFPARGRLKGSGQRFRYVLASNTFIGNAEIAYVLKIGRRSLSIVGNGTLAGSPVVVKIQGNRRR